MRQQAAAGALLSAMQATLPRPLSGRYTSWHHRSSALTACLLLALAVSQPQVLSALPASSHSNRAPAAVCSSHRMCALNKRLLVSRPQPMPDALPQSLCAAHIKCNSLIFVHAYAAQTLA